MGIISYYFNVDMKLGIKTFLNKLKKNINKNKIL